MYISNSGLPNLAKGGTGDILVGLISALLAQNYTGIDAANNAVLTLNKISQQYKKANYSLGSETILDELCMF